MKNSHYVVLVLVSLYFLSATKVLAQSYKKKAPKFTQFTAYAGPAAYIGDLNNFSSFRQILNTRYSGGLQVARELGSGFQGFIQGSYTRLSGDDVYARDLEYYSRNLNFFSDVYTYGLGLRYDLFTSWQVATQGSRLFASIGGAYTTFNPMTVEEYEGSKIALEPLTTEGQGLNPLYPDPYQLSTLTMPIGLEYEKQIKNNWFLGFRMSYNLLFTDYLDDVGGIYPNPALLTSNPDSERYSARGATETVAPRTGENRLEGVEEILTREGLNPNGFAHLQDYSLTNLIGQQRGNGPSKTRDAYLMFNISISYRLPDPVKCP